MMLRWVREGRLRGPLPSKSCLRAALVAALLAAAGCTPEGIHSVHLDSEPAITGNPAADPTLPPRMGQPGRLLLRCAAPAVQGAAQWEVHASARDFDEGRQSFFLIRRDPRGGDTLYPLHGHFLDEGAAGVFMIHDGKGSRRDGSYAIDQSVNMGVLFLRTTEEGLQAILAVFAEDRMESPAENAVLALAPYDCRWGEDVRRSPARADHVRTQPNSGATPPSHWLRESDKTRLTCRAASPDGEYRLELLGSTIWPGHLGFLVLYAPSKQPVGYNVHLLSGGGRLLIHAHSYPHRTRVKTLDTMEETETVIGGLLLAKTAEGYAGWIGLASSAADPYNIAFSRDATLGDYAALGRTVVPPLPVTCK